MAIDFLSVSGGLGDAFNNKRNFVKLAWNFMSKRWKSTWRAAPLRFFWMCGRKEIEGHLEIQNFQNKQ